MDYMVAVSLGFVSKQLLPVVMISHHDLGHG